MWVQVMNAFSVFALVTCMYAVVSVDLFAERSPFFENFGQSMFSLFQVLAAQSVSSFPPSVVLF